MLLWREHIQQYVVGPMAFVHWWSALGVFGYHTHVRHNWMLELQHLSDQSQRLCHQWAGVWGDTHTDIRVVEFGRILQDDLEVVHCVAVKIRQLLVLHWHMLGIQLSPSRHQVMNARDNFPVHRYPCRVGLKEPDYSQGLQYRKCIVCDSSKSSFVGW